MPEDQNLAAMHAYYQRGEEEARLAGSACGLLEFERTREIVLRHLPPPPAVVADVGGGPGRYTHWLADLGYQVVHRDLMPLHVAQLQRARAAGVNVDSALADARDLDLADASVDAVLLLGPLYHLDQRRDRVCALAEARRIARPGAPVFAVAISRWATRMDGVLRQRLYERIPPVEAMMAPLERTGRMPPFYPGSFTGYAHRPGQFRAEVVASGLHLTDLVCVEGPAYLLSDLGDRLADPESRRVVMDTARALERVPELLGIGPHLLATARAGQDGAHAGA
jgi:SAM-dependent methyltransferase